MGWASYLDELLLRYHFCLWRLFCFYRKVETEGAAKPMYLNGKHIKSCTGSDILSLIENAVPESRNLEYKMEVPTGQDEDRKEFLKDVAGLTNGGGGVILYGISEEVDEKKQNTGRPKEIVSVDAGAADKLILGMQETLKACIKPRIPEVEIGTIEVEPGKAVLYVATARSLLAPHMAEFKGNIYFYSRVSSGKFAMSVEEIRAAFLNMSNLVEQVNCWHKERLELLRPGSGCRVPAIVLHIIPVGGQLENIRIPMRRMQDFDEVLKPFSSNYRRAEFNVAGIRLAEQPAESGATAGYVQLFTTGQIEVLNFDLWNLQEGYLNGPELIGFMLERVSKYFEVLKKLGVACPFLLRFELLHPGNLSIKLPTGFRSFADYRIKSDGDDVIFPDIWFEDWESLSNKYIAFKPWLDSLYNAAGRSHCPLYDDNGNWLEQR